MGASHDYYSRRTVAPTITAPGYAKFLEAGARAGYRFVGFSDVEREEPFIILRHDVDIDPYFACKMGEIEQAHGVTGTYFVMLHNGLYNPSSPFHRACLRKLLAMGHSIGLHFDPRFYATDREATLTEGIRREIAYLAAIVETPVYYVSFHKPAAVFLEKDFREPGVFESVYNRRFRNERIHYMSDSLGQWKEEDVVSTVEKRLHRQLQVLTHPALWFHHEETVLQRRLEAVLAERGARLRDEMREALNDEARNVVGFE